MKGGADRSPAITRAFTLIYTLSLLTVFTRIQLNLLGRRNYLSSVISLATPPADASTIRLEDHDDDDLTQTLGNDFETNRRYLAFSWWLLHRGWKQLIHRIQTVVTEVFGPLNPREDISLSKLSELTVQIRMKIEGSTEEERRYVKQVTKSMLRSELHSAWDLVWLTRVRSQNWLSYLLPPREEEDNLLQESGVLGVTAAASPQTASTLRHLLDETADLIESPSFSYVLTMLNNEGFATLVEKKCATDAFKSSLAPEPASQPYLSVPERRTKLANVLAVMARQAHVIGNGANPPNEYLAAMDQGVRELEAFAAVIYSSNFDLELPGSDPKATGRLLADPDSPPTMGDKDEEDAGTATPEQGSSALVTASEGGDAEPVFEKAWGKAMDEGAAVE